MQRCLNKFWADSYEEAFRNNIHCKQFDRKIRWMADVEFRIVKSTADKLMVKQAKQGRVKGVEKRKFDKITEEVICEMLDKLNQMPQTTKVIQDKGYLSIVWMFGCRGGEETYELNPNQFEHKQSRMKNIPSYIQYNKVDSSNTKNNTGGLKDFKHEVKPKKCFDDNTLQHNYYQYILDLLVRLPVGATKLWYYSNKKGVFNIKQPIGVNTIKKKMQSIANICDMNMKVRNHDGRSAKITAMLEKGINPLDVTRHTDHRSIESLRSYQNEASLKREFAIQQQQTKSSESASLKNEPQRVVKPTTDPTSTQPQYIINGGTVNISNHHMPPSYAQQYNAMNSPIPLYQPYYPPNIYQHQHFGANIPALPPVSTFQNLPKFDFNALPPIDSFINPAKRRKL